MSNITYEKGNMTITVAGVDDVANALGDLKAKTPAAVKVALNATAREARKLMIEQAKARYAVNAAGARHLKDLRQRKKATNTNLSAELFIAKMRNDLGYFQYSPTGIFTGAAALHRKEQVVRGRVFRSEQMKALTGKGRMSKVFVVEFKSGHVGMVQRNIGSSSRNRTTARGYRRWTNAEGNVEKLVTMGSPSATAMHHTVWPYIEPQVEDYLQQRLDAQVQRIIDRAAAKKG